MTELVLNDKQVEGLIKLITESGELLRDGEYFNFGFNFAEYLIHAGLPPLIGLEMHIISKFRDEVYRNGKIGEIQVPTRDFKRNNQYETSLFMLGFAAGFMGGQVQHNCEILKEDQIEKLAIGLQIVLREKFK